MESTLPDAIRGQALSSKPLLQTIPNPSPLLNELVQLHEQLTAEGFERLVRAHCGGASNSYRLGLNLGAQLLSRR